MRFLRRVRDARGASNAGRARGARRVKLPQRPTLGVEIAAPTLHVHVAETMVILTLEEAVVPEFLAALLQIANSAVILRGTQLSATLLPAQKPEQPAVYDPAEGWLMPLTPSEIASFSAQIRPISGAWEIAGGRYGVIVA
ncbi:hypothetical protein [Corynebacterium caspium]|uniref:hypothetical protein n=1 Tax=Corynebacterium caspium TaxID=234828 RepID=UPI0003630DD1|nr:hypothetical protein [Corynebacterium caspium]WKD59590.1 hypothetical protein CCASP_06025 [Corynebacterium caspium DSM 44850]